MLTDEFVSRILDKVPELAGKVSGVLEYQRLIKNGGLPAQMPAAFVVPSGLDATENAMSTGLHRQYVKNTIAVVLVVNAPDDRFGQKSVASIGGLVEALSHAIAGWRPPSADGAVNLARGRLIDMRTGTAYYQIDFSVGSYLRTTPS